MEDVPGGKVNILGVTESVIPSKIVHVHVSYSEMELFHCTIPKLLIRNRYYVPFPIPVFIVQVTKVGTVYLV
jgi:hypothetical protein